MKNILILLALLTLISCGEATTGNITISILEDTTEESFQVRPTTEAVVNSFGLREDKWQSARFRYQIITDLNHNSGSEAYLKSAVSLFDNELERDMEVASFEQKIEHIIQDSIIWGRDHSSIFNPLLRELRILQEDTTSVSTLYLFSDLQENDPNFFSVHNLHHQRMLIQEPKIVLELFLEEASEILQSTESLKVVVVYQPQTREEDERFSQMKSLYEDIFMALGIPIEFTTQFNVQ